MCVLSLPSYFLWNKSLVNYKTVKWVAKNCYPLLDASNPVNALLHPISICSLLPPRESRISSNTVINHPLAIKEPSKPWWYMPLVYSLYKVWSCRTPMCLINPIQDHWPGVGRRPGVGGRQEVGTSNTVTDSKVNDLCVLRAIHVSILMQ